MARPLRHLLRSAVVGVAAVSLGLSLAPAAHAGTGDAWLAGELEGGLLVNEQFGNADYGLSIDAALALREVGGRGAEVQSIYAAVADNVEAYTGAGTERYAGSLAKTAALSRVLNKDPRDVGGVNVLARLRDRVSSTPRYAGRIEDASQYGDYANVIGQAFAVQGIQRTGRGVGKRALGFLLSQQCRQGYFRLTFSPKRQQRQGCGQGPDSQSRPDTDATALAVLSLSALPRQNRAVRRSVGNALDWLARSQRRSGAWGGGVATEGANTNSTGLASWALGEAGRCRPAARGARWVADLQVGREPGTPLAGERGAIAYDRAAMAAGRRDGITDATSDQWRRATAQAVVSQNYRRGC